MPPAGIDIGADELVREVAACFGAVGAFHASLENVLFVNGEAGDARRIVRVATRERITIDMAASSSGPTPAPFALYLWTSAPDATTRGAPLELTATLQGILRDDGSEASVPYSLTNAIVLEIRKP